MAKMAAAGAEMRRVAEMRSSSDTMAHPRALADLPISRTTSLA